MAYPSIDEVFKNPIIKLMVYGLGAIFMAAAGVAYHNFDDKVTSILVALNDPEIGINHRIDKLEGYFNTTVADGRAHRDGQITALQKNDTDFASRVDGIEHRLWAVEQIVGRN